MLRINAKTSEIFHLKFASSDEMILHMGRFSDYYESADKNLYRQKFTWENTIDNYRVNRGHSYFEGASGINIPTSIISRMATEFGESLTVREKFIVSLMADIRISYSNLKYVIATCGADDDIDEIAHELAHGFYYTDEVYKMRMDSYIRALPKRVTQEMHNWLDRQMYNPSVFTDELQAYMATGVNFEEKEVFNHKLVSMFRAPFMDTYLEALSSHEVLK